MLEQAYPVAGVLKLVDVSPDLRLPCLLVRRGFSAGRAASVQIHGDVFSADGMGSRQLHENTPHFLDLLIHAEQMLVTQQVSESQLPGLNLGLRPRVKGTVLGPQLLGGIASHPENFGVCHLLGFARECEGGSSRLSLPTFLQFRGRTKIYRSAVLSAAYVTPFKFFRRARESFCRREWNRRASAGSPQW